MFDIGFSELIVCAIVALIVIGPERLPETVRTLGLWMGRLKRGLRETRVEIERQMGVDDIRRQLHNEDILRNIEDARKSFNLPLDQSVENLIAPHVYESEPELPDHAHMHETEQNQLAASVTSTPDASTSAPIDTTKTS
jgi:sec-independent protein translocase protein TatB